MALLDKLTFASSEVKKPQILPVSTIDGKRAKLVNMLREQKSIIEAQIDGRQLILKKRDGSVKSARKWFWSDFGGDKYFFSVRYGVGTLPIGSHGTKPIQVPKLADLPGVIDILVEAVMAGELDAEINKASANTGRAARGSAPASKLDGIQSSWASDQPEEEPEPQPIQAAAARQRPAQRKRA